LAVGNEFRTVGVFISFLLNEYVISRQSSTVKAMI